MESIISRLEAVESHILILEERDREKNSEILALKEKNLSLKQEIFHLKKVVINGKKPESLDNNGEAAMLRLALDFTDLDQLQDEAQQSVNIPDKFPLTEEKRMFGEQLFPLIQRTHQELAGKITGMLLEIDNSELLHLLESEESLKLKVDEAVAVLAAHYNKKTGLHRK